MVEITYGELYVKFCNLNPEDAAMIIDYKPWGNNSIAVWFDDGTIYKVKYIGEDRFFVQTISEEDAKRKFNL